jgi:hypothetical protein
MRSEDQINTRAKLLKAERIALSDEDMLNAVGGKAKVILYPDLMNYQNIDDVLSPYGAAFLLYETRLNYGHWTLLFKRKNYRSAGSTIFFFNSYGGDEGLPDDPLKYISKKFRLKSNQCYPYLSQLLIDCPYDLDYNNYKYQNKKTGTNTCGRWCIVRLLCKKLSSDEFYEYIKINAKKFKLTFDEYVTLLTIE